MTLSHQLLASFPPEVRQRGVDYHQEGRVLLVATEATALVAMVQGTAPYRVAMRRLGLELQAKCDCPFASPAAGPGYPCKHMWAALLAAQNQGALEDSGQTGPLKLTVSPASAPWPGDAPSALIAARHKAQKQNPPLQSPPKPPPNPAQSRPSPLPAWRKQLALLPRTAGDAVLLAADALPLSRQLLYVINVEADHGGTLELQVFFRDAKADGWSRARCQRFSRDLLEELPEESDRKILGLLAGALGAEAGMDFYGEDIDTLPTHYALNEAQARWLLPEICQSGRCYLRKDEGVEEARWLPVAWDGGGPWHLQLTLSASAPGGDYELVGTLVRAGETLELTALWRLSPSVIFTRDGRALAYGPPSARQWLRWLARRGPMPVPAAQREELLAELLRQPGLPALEVPAELAYEEIALTPRPRLTVRPGGSGGEPLTGELAFDYGGERVTHHDSRGALLQTGGPAGARRVVRRDPAAERAACAQLQRLGWRWTAGLSRRQAPRLEAAARHLPRTVRVLSAAGWHVEAEGKRYRAPGPVQIQVSSGIDWFELHGKVEFGDIEASLPDLLAALRAGSDMVRLGDGSYGLLPEEWLKQYGLLAGIGAPQGDHLRFSRSQAALLDVLLAEHPEARCDEVFAHARAELRRFQGVHPALPPSGFQGQLRPYQQEGLGWLQFLRQFGFGGCLADDMGLGKTVQVLALLEWRREARSARRMDGLPPAGPRPSLIVVPKSLIFNWKQEAARFAPRLRVLDHTGMQRQKDGAHFAAHFAGFDVVLTTYGTLRKDILGLREVRFDTVILDEAQAIKNAGSASAKAARLLNCEHRLAMSGTPVENHLGELWSLFEFLNPGMLGAASVFQLARGSERNLAPPTRRVLSQALRPFLLRRTKEQVIKDLPPKVEQTLYCDLERPQRRLYDELRAAYRASLLKQIQRDGIGRTKIQILEALLRLRQAALHPGLLDDSRRSEGCAKLDILLPRLEEVGEEGHKALVFSQFTGMLSIVREHLDAQKIPYEYLDGKTRDREACVKRFQEDPDCRLFLISLKAGGLGLNLTAAQYVFLLDPWWNPAVEAQAIDRAHRLGQRNQVFAYRLIARDTVEEKVLALQGAKRELADAILGGDHSLIGSLGVEDLQLLLS